MLERGIYLAPSQFEAFFVSTHHGVAEIEQTLAAQREALKEITIITENSES
jgi:glutamate-1-semialdehyde 2,1-aminomutase